MARRSHEDALGVAGAETVIGAGVVLQGNLASDADITVDGTLDGSIKTTGDVIIGVNANIKANVEATNVTVAGTLAGDIIAQGETTIRETGNVKGTIKSSGLAISSGAVFIGKSIMEAPTRLHAADEEVAPEPNPAIEAPTHDRPSNDRQS